MTKRSRRTHSPAFKAKVALAAVKGEKTLSELALRATARLIEQLELELEDLVTTASEDELAAQAAAAKAQNHPA